MIPRLIVHGGAWNIPPEYEGDHLNGVRHAIAQVYPLLRDGCTALDAVEAAVQHLEDDPTFDAGRGAVLNADGEVELDAMIMDGATLRFGAVAALQNTLHPVHVARLIMERTEHNLLVGVGARRFAGEMGVPEVRADELVTQREWDYYEGARRDPAYSTRRSFQPEHESDANVAPHGTVGAVAVDRQGNLAAATSTGGTAMKLPGRVGDTPIIGAGTYADNSCGAASATGWGEYVMRVLLTRTACDLLRTLEAPEAAEMAVDVLRQRVAGLGGLILVDRGGRYGFAHSTSKMAFAYVDDCGQVVAGTRKGSQTAAG
jgi:beta-aspartyl-peptidase (threonine type)